MDLGGTWRAAIADEALRRRFCEPDMDDDGWANITVPHHWRSHPEFATSDGPLLYRRRWESPRPSSEQGEGEFRSWLRLDGLFYQGDVWVDGSYLGDTEGYFFPHFFEVTDAVAARSEHLLALEVACNRPADKAAKRNLTGVFEHWDCFDQDWNPGGVWRPVSVFKTGPVRLARLRMLCVEATPARATLELEATFDAGRPGLATITTTVVGPPGTDVDQQSADHPFAAGPNQVRWRVPVDQPALWWPHALGNQPRYDVEVAVSVEGVISDERTVRTGLRRVQMHDFVARVNGERLFLKGANQGPTRRELGEATPEQLEQDVVLAREAGLDLLRVHGHISRPELYDAADRHGMLLWQDLPLQWGYAGAGVRRQAVRQAAEAVDLLGHHPSIAVWCGHNEPRTGANESTTARSLARQALPTWNKSVLDRSIHKALVRDDRSRPVVAHSGVLPHPAWGTDSHLYYGWYVGRERQFPELLARLPVLARFVSEFGAQAVPDDASWCEPERWPDLDWERLERAYCLQKGRFDCYVPPAEYPTFAAWRDATQAYQAQVIRFHIETLRRLKYRPTGGFCQFAFGDGQPAVTWSVLDHERRPKAGWSALAAACAPVIVVADRPEDTYHPGEAIRLAVHVVSDLRAPIAGADCHARLRWPGGDRSWHFTGDVAADSCARVGELRMAAPGTNGPLDLDIDLTWPGGKAHNHYASRIVPRAPRSP